jgi:hypothetical protein
MDDTPQATEARQNNSKPITSLTAEDIQRLRPLRYEKRVARNRFIVLFVVLSMLLVGLLMLFARRH